MHALFFQSMMHGGFGHSYHHSYHRGSRIEREWDDDADKRWRSTTKRPYFENKLPGSEKIFPAAAVAGAATAFGLESLLPLNVPIDKPLMYCSENSVDIFQAKINLNGIKYQCADGKFLMLIERCPKTSTNNGDDTFCFTDEVFLECETEDKIYCSGGTLFSQVDIFCNSTTGSDILNCYEGKLRENKASFVPTLDEGVDDSLSIPAEIHLFLLKLIGKGDLVKRPDVWRPEAITMTPEDLQNVPSTTTEFD
jgi:hypothetical protein